ncbi:hypothetical protein TVAG_349660 [Trichomonas vaginalis G3]|uniref:Uncharacterized protein n=1 Tax=Trichomonas vaginalis (strain ATCC PRA-98 / G3) TaxID=412133 RepID=A2EMP3_TRIV3|nr:armadillo (ARM) repeat-containing protein family [Trichomonas vaginalis G3]EAY06113.1 hypothetical protein TVAG_349660 [Trichomonas vaginalis G3]KAI5497165.1 armadillo (ARM) repeat-containing protein family [Trichomonas vaginalis G3]|eukprot:XP_001318336.1 hypothetical protein [Trichomonas vaginalis G3]
MGEQNDNYRSPSPNFMEFLVSGLSFLVKQKYLQPAEQILSEKLADFETTVSEKADEKLIDSAEKTLISVMNINDGDLSIQFCHRLAECFIFLYSLPEAPKIFNLVTYVQKNPSPAAYFTIGFVVDAIGDHNKAMMGSLTESLLKAKRGNVDSALFALNYILKAAFSETKKYAKSLYSVVDANIHHQSIFVRLLCIKMYRKLIKSNHYSLEKLLKNALVILSDVSDRFLREKAICYVVDCMLLILPTQNGLQIVLHELINLEQPSQIISKLLQFMDNEVLQKNAAKFLALIRKKDRTLIKQFSQLLSVETKKSLFEAVEKEKDNEDQLLILRYLSYDTDSDRTVAAIASKIMMETHDDRSMILQFYDEVSTKNFELAGELLLAATIFLAYPPEQHSNLGRQFVAMALIAAQLITSNPNLVTPTIKENIRLYQEKFFPSPKIYKGGFIGAFITARALKAAADETIRNGLNRVLLALESPKEGSKKVKLLTSAVTGFLASCHSVKSASAFLSIYLQMPVYQQVPAAMSYSFVMATRIQLPTKIFHPLLEFALSVQFTKEFIETRINPRYTKPDTILGRPDAKFLPTIALHMNKDMVMKLVFDAFPIVVNNAPAEDRDMSVLLHNEKYDQTHPVNLLLLLALSKNNDASQFLPEDIHKLLFSMMRKSESDTETNMIAEILSVYCRRHKHAFAKLIKNKKKLPPRQRSFLYASLLHNCDVNDAFIMDAQQDLCDLCKGNDSNYAFFALSVLFQSVQFSNLSQTLAGNSLHFLVGVLNSRNLLNPIVCFYASQCFISLMPLVSSSDDSSLSVVIGEALQCFAGTKSPFCKAFYNRALSQALNFARKTVTKPRIELANRKSTGFEVNASCGAICDLRKDIFEYMDTALYHYQISPYSRIAEFISSCSENSDKVNEWVNLVKDTISSSIIPGTSIEARNEIKRSVLKAMKPLILRIKEKSDTSALDDTITALIKVVTSQTSDDQMVMESFQRFAEIITNFAGAIKLDIYDSQFSIALKYALSLMHVSEEFLRVYTNYINNAGQLQNYIEEITNGVINANDTIPRTNFASYIISTTIKSDNDKIKENGRKIAVALEDAFAYVFNKAVESSQQWQTAAEFRNHYSVSFGDILESLVFALSTTKSQKATYDKLCPFLIETSSKSTEKWRIDASIRGIVSTFEFLENLDDNYKSDCLKNVPKTSEMSLLFELAFSRQLSENDKLLSEFYDYVTNAVYNDEVYCRIIKNADNEFMEKHGLEIFDKFINLPKYESLCSLLFLKTESKDLYEEKILQIEDLQKRVNLSIHYVISTKRCSDKISDLLGQNFDQNVLLLVGRLLKSGQTEIAIKILSKVTEEEKVPETDDLSYLVLLICNKQVVNDCSSFLGLCLKKVANLALSLDKNRYPSACYALKLLKQTDEGLHLLRVLPSETMTSLADKFEALNKAKSTSNRFALKTFGNIRKPKDQQGGDWVDLDGKSDSDE